MAGGTLIEVKVTILILLGLIVLLGGLFLFFDQPKLDDSPLSIEQEAEKDIKEEAEAEVEVEVLHEQTSRDADISTSVSPSLIRIEDTDERRGTEEEVAEKMLEEQTDGGAGIPTDVSLPFVIEDVDEKNGVVNPLGVVRFSKDQGNVGHGGIDIPLVEGALIRAVADGEIVGIQPAGDPWGGIGIYLLLKRTSGGEGWGFIYEHMKPRAGLKVGDTVKKGEVIAAKIAPEGFTAHFQLSMLFNNFTFTRDNQCWPDTLSAESGGDLNMWWQDYRESDHLVNSWDSIFEEGKYPFRGLLDEAVYPEGPQLCYAPETDVRQ